MCRLLSRNVKLTHQSRIQTPDILIAHTRVIQLLILILQHEPFPRYNRSFGGDADSLPQHCALHEWHTIFSHCPHEFLPLHATGLTGNKIEGMDAAYRDSCIAQPVHQGICTLAEARNSCHTFGTTRMGLDYVPANVPDTDDR